MDNEGSNSEIAPGDTTARSKTETDIEQHVLGTTVKLSDGSEGFVFSRTPRNKDLLFGYSCHICGVVCLYGERMLQIHMAGRKHQARLSVTMFDAEQYHATFVTKSKSNTATVDETGNTTEGQVSMPQPLPAATTPQVQGNDLSSSRSFSRLQNVLDGYRNGPLVGLEYIIELIDSSSMGNADPTYRCLLCSLNDSNESSITTHMIGMPHRFKFLDRHYPLVHRKLALHRNASMENGGNVFSRVVQTVCEAIEDHHGRLKPQVFEAEEFERNRVKYAQQIAFGTHFDERTGPKFTEVIDAKMMQDLTAGDDAIGHGSGAPKRYRNRNERGSLDSISSVSSVNSMMTISSSDEDRSRNRQRNSQNGGGMANRLANESKRANAGVPTTKHQLLPTPRELSQQSAEIAHERYKWEKYRCTVDLAVGQLEKKLKDYEKNPEKHPLYSDEWKKFWNRRYKELQAEKKDPQKHNFKPEWIEFWTKRMKELHTEDVQRKKEEIRTKMKLPPEAEERTDELREQYSLRIPTAGKRSRSVEKKGVVSQSPKATIFIDVNSDEEEDDYQGGQPLGTRGKNRSSATQHSEWPPVSRKRSISRTQRSRSPFSDDNNDPSGTYTSSSRGHRGGDWSTAGPVSMKPRAPAPERIDYDEWAKNYYGPNKKVFVRTEFEGDNTPLNFIAVCRLLTAFEEYLGSLGPKVIDLLAKALALEKVKANSADDLLLNEDNCMFLETVKEKLKGHMMAETIDPPKMAPIKKAVRNIARLLHEASKREPLQTAKLADEEQSRDSFVLSEPATTAPPVATSATGVDKIAVAEQLAKSLVAQGKTDFTTEELEQLINVYIAMAQMSRERKTIITTNAYIASLPAAAVATNVPLGHKEPIVGSVTTAKPAPGREPERPRPDVNPMLKGLARLGGTVATGPMSGSRASSSSTMMMGMDSIAAVTGSSSSETMLENLTDSDLQTLLQSFKELSNEEQMHLISYLRKLERTEPDRVDKLRRYVNFDAWKNVPAAGGGGTDAAGGSGHGNRDLGRHLSEDDDRDYHDFDDNGSFDMFQSSEPAQLARKPNQNKNSNNAKQQPALRLQQQQRHHQEQQKQQLQQQQQLQPQLQLTSQKQQQQRQKDMQNQQKGNTIIDDSEDEDDYSYDDILRAASKNVTTVPQQRSKTPADAYDTSSNNSHRANAASSESNLGPVSLTDTQNLIANLMESLQKSVSDANSQPTNTGGSSSSVGAGSGPSSTYTNPITTIGSLAGAGVSTTTAGVSMVAAPNTSTMYPSFGQQQQMQGQMGMQQQQPMGLYGQQTQGQMGQFGGQFMYQGQGQMFGSNNGQGQQQMQQYGYGNYGGYY